MLWHVALSTCLVVAHADEFGISRRTPAQTQQPSQQVLPYVTRIIAFDSSGQSFGTGSYVGTYGEYGVVLTNSHVVCATKGLVHVHFLSSGFSSFGYVVKSDPQWDLALVAISKPPQSVPMLTISQTPSKPGDPLWIAGWGSGSYRVAGGQCVQYLSLPNQTDAGTSPKEIVEVSVSARKGDSGGPILNQKGELAGVLFGSDMIRNTAGSYCKRVNRFLLETQSAMVGLPSRPETHFATVEKNGPTHKLEESRNAVPQNTQGAVTPNPNPPALLPGARSTSRRYVAPMSTRQSQGPLREQPSAVVRITSTSLPSMPVAEPAEMLSKFGMSFQPAKIVPTTHLLPLEPISMPMMIPTANVSADNRYRLKLSADRSDWFFSLFMVSNACLAAGLTCVAVRLLRT